MRKSVLLCPPTYFDVIDMKNPYMVGQSPVDKKKACAQWEALRAALEAAGLKVETIEPVPGLEDMVFAANQVFVGCHEKIGNFVVPSRMRHASRQREVAHYVDWFRHRGYKILDFDLGVDYLEGGGDLMWHPHAEQAPRSAETDRRHPVIYAGYGFRSTIGGVRRFSKAMSEFGIQVIELELVDPRFYHLDTCFSPLNADAAIIYPSAFADSAVNLIPTHFSRVHEISESEALGFEANGIVVGNYYLTSRLTANLEKILAQENLNPIVVNTSEFEKSGGSCYCMKNLLE